MQLKIEVLAIPAVEKRTYAGRSWYQRSLQCIADDKVFVHNQTAPIEADDDTDDIKAQRKSLQNLQKGFYMADLVLEQGDRAKPVFAIRNMTPIKQGQA